MFKFDRVFDGVTTQEELYQEMQIDNLVNKVVEVHSLRGVLMSTLIRVFTRPSLPMDKQGLGKHSLWRASSMRLEMETKCLDQ